jgi:hypothetical protein
MFTLRPSNKYHPYKRKKLKRVINLEFPCADGWGNIMMRRKDELLSKRKKSKTKRQ